MYRQTSGQGKNARIGKYDSNGLKIWDFVYEQTPVDTKATICYIDDLDELWVAFTSGGGDKGDVFINKLHVEEGAFSNVLASTYGMGGGPLASVIANIDKETGKIKKGTFLYSILPNGKTNTIKVVGLGQTGRGRDSKIVVEAHSFYRPPVRGFGPLKPDETLTNDDRDEDGSFHSRFVLTRSLNQILEANHKAQLTTPLLIENGALASYNPNTPQEESPQDPLNDILNVSPPKTSTAQPLPSAKPDPSAQVVQPTPAPVVQPTPAPVVQPTPAPVVQPTPIPVVQPTQTIPQIQIIETTSHSSSASSSASSQSSSASSSSSTTSQTSSAGSSTSSQTSTSSTSSQSSSTSSSSASQSTSSTTTSFPIQISGGFTPTRRIVPAPLPTSMSSRAT